MPRIEPAKEQIDQLARDAMRHVIENSDRAAFAKKHSLNPRTVERLYARAMAVPPRLAEELAAEIECVFGVSDFTIRVAMPLRAWADANPPSSSGSDRAHEGA